MIHEGRRDVNYIAEKEKEIWNGKKNIIRTVSDSITLQPCRRVCHLLEHQPQCISSFRRSILEDTIAGLDVALAILQTSSSTFPCCPLTPILQSRKADIPERNFVCRILDIAT